MTMKTISTPKLEELINKGEYLLLDVRTASEFNECHIPGSVNVPLDKLGAEIKQYKDKKIILTCRSGGRASIAYEAVKDVVADCICYKGSLNAWCLTERKTNSC